MFEAILALKGTDPVASSQKTNSIGLNCDITGVGLTVMV